jgi:hypothetical protein
LKRFRLLPSILLLALGGCLDSKFPIASDDVPKVNRAFVGDWTIQDEKNDHLLVIRNWDEKEYYVEWPDRTPLRMRGFLVKVNGESFANLKKLEEDGSISDSYLIVKVSLKDDVLTIQNLNEDYFKANPPADGKARRATIAANVTNPKMYDDKPIRATRAAAQATTTPTTKP